MTRIGHLKKSTTLFPQRVKGNNAKYELSAAALGSQICNDELLERKKDLKSSPDLTGFEFSSAGSIVPYKEYKQRSNSGVKCFLCSKLIKSEHLSEHLLFSEVECGKCNTVMKNCQDFQMWLVEKNIRGDLCEHVLEYSGDTMEKLKTCLVNDIHGKKSVLTAEKIENLLRKYINGIISLRNILPWEQAIAEFREYEDIGHWHSEGKTSVVSKTVGYVNQVKSSCMNELLISDISSVSHTSMENSLKNAALKSPLKSDSPELPLSKLCADDSSMHYEGNFRSFKKGKGPSAGKINGCSLNKKRKSGSDPIKKTKTALGVSDKRVTGPKQSKSSDYVETPADGFYYVVRRSITECPNCYESLRPVDFSVNIVTFLMTAVCRECNLKIYIVQDPPDDNAPRVCIVTDQKTRTGKDAKLTKTKKFKHNSLPEQ